MIGLHRRKKPFFLLLMVVLSLKAAILDVHAQGQGDTDPSQTEVWDPGNRSGHSAGFTAGGDPGPALPRIAQYAPSEPDKVKPPPDPAFEQPRAAETPVPDTGELTPAFTPHQEIAQIGPEDEDLLREVRDLINKVREIYFAGNFDEAEEMLIRYRISAGVENSEITYWLTLIRGARSLRSGRVIPVTAPLYAEMSQLLSDAKKSYAEGLLFINTDRRSAGLTKLTEARQKTQQIRLLFPVNDEADFLELRIDQITNPSAFNRSFRRRLDEAVAGIKRRSRDAFDDLQTLALINPQYPGLGDILDQAELDMGYRLPPPNPQDLAQSNELTVAAENMIDPQDRSQYPFALELLNQALRLNPHNRQALALRDYVQTGMGETEAIVLDDDAEADYQRAVQELQEGNPITALSIIRQLLRNPRYRNSTKIIALQRRIESVL
ncbi:hypothetical protein LQZ21_05560 [Treponema sp. TIM-1]|uniref:hypothetical protein n=1 Tax=Treponema sp. TIM-1 TaxID=2898417 RepID=UPI00397F6049